MLSTHPSETDQLQLHCSTFEGLGGKEALVMI